MERSKRRTRRRGGRQRSWREWRIWSRDSSIRPGQPSCTPPSTHPPTTTAAAAATTTPSWPEQKGRDAASSTPENHPVSCPEQFPRSESLPRYPPAATPASSSATPIRRASGSICDADEIGSTDDEPDTAAFVVFGSQHRTRQPRCSVASGFKTFLII